MRGRRDGGVRSGGVGVGVVKRGREGGGGGGGGRRRSGRQMIHGRQ